MILRVALAFASLAWAGFVFTHTVGDPGRGDRIARAVLEDDEARAEVAAPITTSVMRSTGLPADQRPLVKSRVDQLLLQPDGARVFIDAFAGGWSRMLGDDTDAGTRVDMSPFVTDIVAVVPGLDPSVIPTDTAVPASVPVPPSASEWLGDLRKVIDAVVLPLAILAAVGIGIALAFGDRRWVLRRIGIWAALAGVGWLVGPMLATWLAQQWATSADEVVRVAAREATSGLRPAALVLCIAGVAAFVASFVIAGQPAPVKPDASPTRASRQPAAARHPRPQRTPRPAWNDEPATTRTPAVTRTATMPQQAVPQSPPVEREPVTDDADPDALWNFYTDPDGV